MKTTRESFEANTSKELDDDSTRPSKCAKTWDIPASIKSKRTRNPIREIVDNIKKPNNPSKPMIPLSLGDPTVFGNLSCPRLLVESVVENARTFKSNGYCHSAGTPAAREAIAAKYTHEAAPLTANDVVIASGCSGALELAISALLNEGDNILLPEPGFSLYQVIAESIGAKCKFYRLLPERGWEADVEQMASLIDDRTRCILVNNPSNPCGSVFSKQHLLDILAVADENRLPILADEIYGAMAFTGHTFTPMAQLTDSVPIISAGGIAKQFLVPGWRLGWLTLHDRHGRLGAVSEGIVRLSQLVLGASQLVQSALPAVLTPAAGSTEAQELTDFHAEYMSVLERQARLTVERVSAIPGLRTVTPQGAMYVMTEVLPEAFKDIPDATAFTQMLLEEESVFVLPGECFGVPKFFRIVFSAPEEKLTEAYERMHAFCLRHAK